MCCRCPVTEAIAATTRMLDHRGARWEPADPSVAALPRIAALLSPHAREFHAAGCVYRMADGSALVVVTDLDRMVMGPIKQAAAPAFLAAALGGVEQPSADAPELQLVASVPPNTQTLKLLPSNASVVPWSLVLTYPLDHEIVPPQRRATAADLRVAGLARCKPSLLPCIRSDDPVVQYLHLRAGEILRIDRQDGSLYFRHVIAARDNGCGAVS